MMLVREEPASYGSRFVGRKEEINTLEECLYSDQSEFIAVYGRRRVGKTYLIRYVLEKHFSLFATGLPGGSYLGAKLFDGNNRHRRAHGAVILTDSYSSRL